MYRLGQALSRLITFTTLLGGAAIVLMMLHISFDVMARHLLASPLPGTITIVANYYMVLVAFLPLAFAEEKNGHISVEVLTEFLPAIAQKHLFAWTHLLSAAVFGALCYSSWGEAAKKQAIGTFIMQENVKVLIWPSYYLLPIGCGLMVAVLLYRFAAYVLRARSGLDESRATPGDAQAD